MTIRDLIIFGYDIRGPQVSGGPTWINSEKYDIEAKEEDSMVVESQNIIIMGGEARKLAVQSWLNKWGGDPLRLEVQSLLAERFKLRLSRETKNLQAYALVIAKNGPKLLQSKTSDASPIGDAGRFRMGVGQIKGEGVPISAPPHSASLAQMLSDEMDRTVLDQTGLKGNFDFTLRWTPDESEVAMFRGPTGGSQVTTNAPLPESSGPSIFTALQEQLGLKLVPTKGPVEVLVIDRIERPSTN